MTPHVRILVATYNGATYLPEQLASIAAQSHTNWSLAVGDDKSQDATRDVVSEFAATQPEHEVTLTQGPCRGSAANFLALAGQPQGRTDSYVAFSDQDDIWMPGRLSRALEMLARVSPVSTPAVYASRTMLAGPDGTPHKVSRWHCHSPAFENALVQNILPGNTLVLNPAAAALLQRTATAALDVPHHDWWVYQLMTGAGARVVLDQEPSLYYRQHGNNLLGANRGLRQGMTRLGMVRDGRYRDWVDRNQAALEAVSKELTPDAQARLAQFAAWRRGEIGFDQSGVWRQTYLGNVLLRLAVAAGRL